MSKQILWIFLFALTVGAFAQKENSTEKGNDRKEKSKYQIKIESLLKMWFLNLSRFKEQQDQFQGMSIVFAVWKNV